MDNLWIDDRWSPISARSMELFLSASTIGINSDFKLVSRVIPFFTPSHETLLQRFARFNVVLMNFYASFSTFLSLTPSKWFRHIFILLVLRFILNEHRQWDRKKTFFQKPRFYYFIIFNDGIASLRLNIKIKFLKLQTLYIKHWKTKVIGRKNELHYPFPFD